MVQLFAEVRRRKPSVIFIPNVDSWYYNVGGTVLSTFLSLLRTLAPTDPVLLLGIVETEAPKMNEKMIKDLFGFSKKNQYELYQPDKVSLEPGTKRSHLLENLHSPHVPRKIPLLDDQVADLSRVLTSSRRHGERSSETWPSTS